MRLILVRHGESVGNSENRLQGHEDYDLTDLGRRQASLTAERLAAEETAHVYSSSLLRALATAEVAAARLGREPVVLPDLSEYHFGEMAGETYADLRQRFGTSVSAGERVYPGEEGRDVFYRRVTSAIWQIVEAHPGESVAVVTHAGPIALFCQSVLGLPYRRPMPFSIDNCSLNLVEVAETAGDRASRAVLVSINDACHLSVASEG